MTQESLNPQEQFIERVQRLPLIGTQVVEAGRFAAQAVASVFGNEVAVRRLSTELDREDESMISVFLWTADLFRDEPDHQDLREANLKAAVFYRGKQFLRHMNTPEHEEFAWLLKDMRNALGGDATWEQIGFSPDNAFILNQYI